MSEPVIISGVKLPINKKVFISLQSIFGIGQKRAIQICSSANVDHNLKLSAVPRESIDKMIKEINNYTIEGDLKKEVRENIKHLQEIGCYRGSRHKLKLPVRGQRTKTNARTRKGKRVAIAGKKINKK